MQVRKLKIPVPVTYKRIAPVTAYLRDLQEELIEYQDAILDDSDYESDGEVLRKYSKDPLKYIIANDERKRDTVEQTGITARIHKARIAKGHKHYKDLY